MADSSTITRRAAAAGGPVTGTLPICKSCVLDVRLFKTATLNDLACAYSSNGSAAYSLWSGYCQRYMCANGYYYYWSGWDTTTDCNPYPISATECPNGTCKPSY